MRIIDDAALFTPPGESPNHWAERFRVPDLSVGTYSIPAGGTDDQAPHDEDEIYVVIGGRAILNSGSGPGRFGDLCARRGEPRLHADHRGPDPPGDLRSRLRVTAALITPRPAWHWPLPGRSFLPLAAQRSLPVAGAAECQRGSRSEDVVPVHTYAWISRIVSCFGIASRGIRPAA